MEAKRRLRPAGPVDVNRHSGKTGGLCVCVCLSVCVCRGGGESGAAWNHHLHAPKLLAGY